MTDTITTEFTEAERSSLLSLVGGVGGTIRHYRIPDRRDVLYVLTEYAGGLQWGSTVGPGEGLSVIKRLEAWISKNKLLPPTTLNQP
jgi:hypothetical protein